jgi:hypothetical protein
MHSVTNTHIVTATLTDDEWDLLEAFAAEQGIENLSDAVPAMLHELVRLHDALWDAQFAISTEPLDEMARKALEDHEAGLTEEWNTDTDSR